MGVPEPARLRQCLVHSRPRPSDEPQIRQSHREVREHHGVGICGHFRPDDAVRRIRQAMTPLQEGSGGNEVPEEAAGQPMEIATLRLHRDIVLRLADFLDFLGKRQRQPVLGSGKMKNPLAND